MATTRDDGVHSRSSLSHRDLLEGFRGAIEPARASLLYRTALVFVAVAMVFLPVIYLSAIAAIGCGVVFHAINNVPVPGSGWSLQIQYLVYLAPLIVGPTLIFFMIKPLFARPAAAPLPIAVSRTSQPLLFTFVENVCDMVGAPRPGAIYVDCQVNASAGFRRDPLNVHQHDLTLTIGLPLVAGLELNQLGGILAHEFGHFSQSAGLRISFLIRRINHWFARVVYERDAWDARLERWSARTGLHLILILLCARTAIWLTRRVLWCLMVSGHLISNFMLRQMEHDADHYETFFGGSLVFRNTMHRALLLELAATHAYGDLEAAWQAKELSDNLPELIVRRLETIPRDERRKFLEGALQRRTRWIDSHPSPSERIKIALDMRTTGKFRLEGQASELFRNFDVLCRRVSIADYERVLGTKIERGNLVPSKKLLETHVTLEKFREAETRVLKGYRNRLRPPFPRLDELDARVDDLDAELHALAEASCRFDELREFHSDDFHDLEAAIERLLLLSQAEAFVDAGIPIHRKVFGLESGSADDVALEVQQVRTRLDELRDALSPLDELLMTRLTLAMRLFRSKTFRARLGGDQAWRKAEIPYTVQLLGAYARTHAEVVDLKVRQHQCESLLACLVDFDDDQRLRDTIARRSAECAQTLERVRREFEGIPYPFALGASGTDVADYLNAEDVGRSVDVGENVPAKVTTCVGVSIARYFSLFSHLIGALSTLVESAARAPGHSRREPRTSTPTETPGDQSNQLLASGSSALQSD